MASPFDLRQRIALAGAAALTTLVAPTVHAAAEPAAATVSFSRDVRPLLSDRCFTCHGPDAEARKARLRLDQATGREGAYRRRGGSAAIAPGAPERSELWRRVTSRDAEEAMPPPDAHEEPLSAEELRTIRLWIEAGAPYEDFWSFVPPEAPPLPEVKDRDWSERPIDLHVLRRLETEGLRPSPEADRRTLIRRLTLDLTGLPPTRDEIRAFLADERPEAYEALVDRLLASPRYGEHMARYWLDLVRFADTNGMHKDFYRNVHAYRDWVIRAFNENLPYDDFVRYQLAGDLAPEPSDDQLIASGFHRLHLIIDRGTALPEESHYKNVVDRVTAVGTAFLGMTVQCASCHDHKYDPITQKDFYSLYAFFNNIDAQPETNGAPKNGLQPPTALVGPAAAKSRLREVDGEIARLDGEIRRAETAAKAAAEAETETGVETGSDAEAETTGAPANDVAALKARRKELADERARVERSLQRVMVMKERAEIRPAHIMIRGQYDAPGEEVARATPAFLPELKKEGDVATRRDLAEWFVDDRHPLTARVAVNRFWQQLLGVGLVKTSEDLGAQGEVPSHPELLDHLAVSFVESGWDVKALVRQIVTSRTYRQTSVASPDAFRRDPENRLLARGSRYRMDAEMVRDLILATSGRLSATMYGASVKPPQPDGLWKAVTMIGERFRADTGEAIVRRSVYTFWKRAMPPPQMTILNAPIRDACTARRERTNTPAQALLLLNESEFVRCALHLARRLLANEWFEDAERLDAAYETITSRLPDDEERAVLSKLVRDLEARYRETPELAGELCRELESGPGESVPEGAGDRARLAAWTVLVNTLYNLDITKTRA